jgi:hypothetical protein
MQSRMNDYILIDRRAKSFICEELKFAEFHLDTVAAKPLVAHSSTYVTLQFTRQRRTIRCANVRPQTLKIMASTLTAVTVNFVALMSTIFNATRQRREMWKGMLTVNCLVKFCGRTAAKRTFELLCLSTKMLEHKSFACHAALTGVTSMKVVYSVRRSTAPRIKWLWLHVYGSAASTVTNSEVINRIPAAYDYTVLRNSNSRLTVVCILGIFRLDCLIVCLCFWHAKPTLSYRDIKWPNACSLYFVNYCHQKQFTISDTIHVSVVQQK